MTREIDTSASLCTVGHSRNIIPILKVPLLRYGTDREMLVELVRECVT